VASQAPPPLGDPGRTARLWGAAEALREAIGAHLTPRRPGQARAYLQTQRVVGKLDSWHLQ
jgi:hypothetical protein